MIGGGISTGIGRGLKWGKITLKTAYFRGVLTDLNLYATENFVNL